MIHNSTHKYEMTYELKMGTVKQEKFKVINKRCMKDFAKEKWNHNLAAKRWEEIGETEDVEAMASIFGNLVEESLNDCAPWNEIKVRSNHVFGLSDDTKEAMKERDKMRENVKKSSPTEKRAMQLKYKKQRNMVTSMQRKDNIAQNVKKWRKQITLARYGN